MARDGLCVLLCAGMILGAVPRVHAAPGEDTEAKMHRQLAVQAALQQGLDHLKRGDYQAAVFVLESQIARIDTAPRSGTNASWSFFVGCRTERPRSLECASRHRTTCSTP